MRAFLFSFSLAAALFLGGLASPRAWASSEEALKIAEFLEQNQMHLSFGFLGLSLKRNGKPLRQGFLGSGLLQAFEKGSKALAYARLYHALLISGVSLTSLGLGTLVVELVLLSIHPSFFLGPLLGFSPAFWGILLGGFLLGVVGSILFTVAQSTLGQAVEEHNRSLLQIIRLRRWSLQTPVGGRFPQIASLPAFRVSF